MQKSYFYVCGDAANMAREVNTVLGQIISEQRGIPESKAEDIVKSMRSANQYQVCYTLSFYCPFRIIYSSIKLSVTSFDYPGGVLSWLEKFQLWEELD